MAELISTSSPVDAQTLSVQGIRQKIPPQLWIAALLGLTLMAAPRSRVVIGAPVYFIDILAVFLLILPLRTQLSRWVPKTPFNTLAAYYLAAILISEMRGMMEYGTVLESTYMMIRYTVVISVFLTIPRLISKPEHLDLVLKGVILGGLISAVIVILYSMGPTRPLIVNAVFTKTWLNPGWQRLLEVIAIFGAGEAAMRGRSLIGAGTMTAGFLSVVWPLAFITYNRFDRNFLWKRISLAAMILMPIGVLMTYGRGAWIMVGVVMFLIAVFGLASGRKVLLMAIVGITIAATQFKIDRDLFYFERVFDRTRDVIENPFADASTTERLLSFIEPFGHLAENPSWVFAGAGRAGNRATRRGDLGGQLYDQGGKATHSGFAMSYYSFGVLGAACQLLMIVLGFRFIATRISQAKHYETDQKIIWQALLMSWCTYTLWWVSGHAMVGEPRGTMLSFMLMGLLVSFEKFRLIQLAETR